MASKNTTKKTKPEVDVEVTDIETNTVVEEPKQEEETPMMGVEEPEETPVQEQTEETPTVRTRRRRA